MNVDELHKTMLKLAKAYALDPDYGSFAVTIPRAQIESTAHELAHGLCLSGRAISTREIAQELDEIEYEDRNLCRWQDRQELRALRVETAALKILGVPFSRRKIVEQSTYRLKTPTRAQQDAPLTYREKRLVQRFVRLVRGAA